MAPREASPYSVPGVSVFQSGGEWLLRWKDPQTGRVRQRAAQRLGLLKANGEPDKTRIGQWARGKAKQLVALRAAVENGTLAEQPVALDAALVEHLATFREPTRRSRRRVLNEFGDFMRKRGVLRLQDLDELRLAQWSDYVGSATFCFAPATVGRWAKTTRAFCHWAARRKQLPKVSAMGMRDVLRIPAASRRLDILWPADVRRMLRAAMRRDAVRRRPAYAPFVLFLLTSGVRLHEALGLRWSDVRFEQGLLVVRSSKTDSERVVGWDVSPVLGKLLAAIKLGQRGDIVWPVRRFWCERIAAKAELMFGGPGGWSCHTLRRTCSSVLGSSSIYGGGSAALLAARRAGHDLATADKHYLNAIPGLPRDARSIEAALGIEELANAIVASVGGTEVPADVMREPAVPAEAQAG